MQDAMSKSRQRALAQTLKQVLNEAELTDLRILISAASHRADELINLIAPAWEDQGDFERAYAQRDEALNIGNALNRFDAI